MLATIRIAPKVSKQRRTPYLATMPPPNMTPLMVAAKPTPLFQKPIWLLEKPSLMRKGSTMPPAMVSPILYNMTKASAKVAPLREKKSTNGLTTASAIVRGGHTTSGSGARQVATMPTIISSAITPYTRDHGMWSDSTNAPAPETSMAMR